MKTSITMFLLALFCVPAMAAGDSSPTDIRSARSQQNAAMARHDVDAIASYWTDDVSLCRGLGAQLTGKAAYRKLFEDEIAGSPDLIVYVRTPTLIDVGKSWPLAFETGVWTGHRGTARGPVLISGRYSAQWVRRAGKWLIRSEVFVALKGADAGLQMKAVP
jgi:ketosteroid isomerase-like protein